MGRGGDRGSGLREMMANRLKGKQFAMVPGRRGGNNDALFQAFPRFLEGEKYEQKMPAPAKAPSKGFLTSGMRGEALLVRRCQALKEMLEKDQRYARQARQKAHHLPPMEGELPTLPPPKLPRDPLFDLVYETKDEWRKDEAFLREQLKLVADTKNPTRMRSGRQRDTGCYRTSMQAYGVNHYNGGKLEAVQASFKMIPKANGFGR